MGDLENEQMSARPWVPCIEALLGCGNKRLGDCENKHLKTRSRGQISRAPLGSARSRRREIDSRHGGVAVALTTALGRGRSNQVKIRERGYESDSPRRQLQRQGDVPLFVLGNTDGRTSFFPSFFLPGFGL